MVLRTHRGALTASTGVRFRIFRELYPNMMRSRLKPTYDAFVPIAELGAKCMDFIQSAY